MLATTILDVAFGLIFAFLTISLATSSLVEAGASFLQVRAKLLLRGVQSLVNNPALVKKLYDHALINPRNPGDTAGQTKNQPSKNPSYIDPAQFAAALMDIAGISQQLAASAAASTPAAQNVSALTTTIGTHPDIDAQMRSLLTGIFQRAIGDPDKIKSELAAWFDNGMDRLSGLYKRWTQAISFVVALVLALVMNIDSIGIARELWAQPVLAEKIKMDSKIPDPQDAAMALEKAIPIGWPSGRPFHKLIRDTGNKTDTSNNTQNVNTNSSDGSKNDDVNSGGTWIDFSSMHDFWIPLLGWLITAVAALFGAPFWFDALQNITRLKGTGPSPTEKKNGSAASA